MGGMGDEGSLRGSIPNDYLSRSRVIVMAVR